MSGDPALVEEWFARLLALDRPDRTQALAELERTHPQVAAEVASLLAAHDRDGGPLEALADLVPTLAGAEARLGTTVARYAITAVAGKGGMGVVYRATDTRLGREVALKFLPPWLGRDPAARERLIAEARAVSALDHPNICTLHEIGEAEGEDLFLVMPFYEGTTLRERLADGPVPPAEARAIAAQVARGLAAAHARGIVHRDIKPGNLLLTADGVVKILDFGVAKASDVHLTRTGERLGTLAYMAPEQLTGEPVDARTDLYALGVVLHEMLTGQRPVVGRPPVPVPGGGTPLGALLARLLALDPAERPATAREVVAVLEADTRPPVASRRTLAVALVTAAALVAAGSYLSRAGPRAGDSTASILPAATGTDLRVAVLPFRTVGDGMTYWREGIVDLLSLNLDGLGDVRKTAPEAVTRIWTEHVGRDEGEVAQPDVLHVARLLGARYAVTGSAVAIGPTVRLTAEVHDVARGSIAGTASVDGPADSVLSLVDGLALALVRERLLPVSPEAPVNNLERATTASVPALKAYLEGERAYRVADWDGAAAAYQRATELDSTFARAWWRRSAAATWRNETSAAAEFRDIALRHGDRLAPRDRLLVGARTVEQLRDFVTQYPDEAEGWARYGDAAFHQGGLRILPVDTFRLALERAVRLLPFEGEPYSHLLEEAFARRDSGRVRALLDGLEVVGAGQATCPTEWLLAEAAWGSGAARARARAALDTVPGQVLLCGWTSLPIVPGVVARAEAVALGEIRTEAPFAGLQLWRALHTRMTRGEVAAARRLLAVAESSAVLAQIAVEHGITLHLLGRIGAAEAAPWRAFLERKDTPGAHFWLAALAAREGDTAEVAARADRLDALRDGLTRPSGAPEPRFGEVARALGWIEAGDIARGLPALVAALPTMPTASWRADHFAVYVRLRTAERLLAAADTLAAMRWYASLNHYEWQGYLPAQLALATLLEARGERAAAHARYAQVAAWWADADPPFHADRRRAEAGARRTAEPPP